MDEISGDSQLFKPFTFLDIDSNMELLNHCAEFNPNGLENLNLSLQSFMGFSNDNFFPQQQPEFAMQFTDSIPSLYHSNGLDTAPIVQFMASAGDVVPERKKQKTMAVSESSSGNSSTLVSETGLNRNEKIKRKNNLGRGRRRRSTDKEREKSKEVIHVRARRGQATDSHSLAERVRREKINERLRFLQELVPGCYKTMGMAAMLDEIINYVQSLQNQVEFLSMKLSAASSAHEYNPDIEVIGAMQPYLNLCGDLKVLYALYNPDIEVLGTMQGTNAYEAQDVEMLTTEGYGGFTFFHSTWPF